MRVLVVGGFILVAVLYVGLALPLMRRRVRPNYFYGLRVPATLADESVWYEANARSGRDLLAIGIIIGVAAIAGLVLPTVPVRSYALVCLGVLFVLTIAAAIRGWIMAGRLLRQKQQGGSSS